MTPEALARLHAEAAPHTRAWSASEFADLLNAPGALLVTVTPHCFALARIVLDEGEVLMIATHPDARRRGLAQSCLQGLHERAARQGAVRLFLEVDAANTAARALYAAAGYVRTGLRRGYYRSAAGRVSDAILMTRDMTRPPWNQGTG